MEKLTELEDALLRLGQRAVCDEGMHELYRVLRGCLPEDVQTNLGGEEDPSVRASTPGGEEAVMAAPDHLARRGEKRSQEKQGREVERSKEEKRRKRSAGEKHCQEKQGR